jgi:hypothetical protein
VLKAPLAFTIILTFYNSFQPLASASSTQMGPTSLNDISWILQSTGSPCGKQLASPGIPCQFYAVNTLSTNPSELRIVCFWLRRPIFLTTDGHCLSALSVLSGHVRRITRIAKYSQASRSELQSYCWPISAATSSPNFFRISFWVSGSKSVISNIRRTSTISLSCPGMREAHSSASSRDFTSMIQ